MATVTGFVEDTTHARISRAKITLLNIQTGTENRAQTGNLGSFLLLGVIPGGYTLQIERDGFATTQISGLTLNIGDTRNFLIRMRIGSVRQTITVNAAGSLLNTSDASVATVIDQKFVSNIPLNGRSFQDLVTMTPGIVTRSPQTSGGLGASNAAFMLPDGNAAGDAPRNMLRGFGQEQFNLGIRREIPLHDRLGVQLRFDTFNLLNHPNLGYIDPSLTDALFGQATLTLNQSFGNTESLYTPGGPRSMQFSLRVHF